jgi:hypothetical protein
MKKHFFSILFVIILGGSASSNEKQTYILNNLQEDFTTCYSYYKIAGEGISRGRELDQETIDGLNRSADIALQSAYLIGQQLNMKTEAMSARVKMAFQRMQDEMGSDFINFSVILDKYAYYCKDVIEKPEQRIQYWENKY